MNLQTIFCSYFLFQRIQWFFCSNLFEARLKKWNSYSGVEFVPTVSMKISIISHTKQLKSRIRKELEQVVPTNEEFCIQLNTKIFGFAKTEAVIPTRNSECNHDLSK